MESKLLQCPSCFCTISADQENCEYCGNKIVIETINDMSNLSSEALRNYGRSYTKNLEQGIGDRQEMEGALAFIFLKMKLYEKAEDHFSKAVDEFCNNPDLYYGWAISILRGKGAYGCYRETVDEAMSYLNAALSIEKKGIYYYFQAFLSYDYFFSKGFRVSPNYVDYLNLAIGTRNLTRADINHLYELLNVPCPDKLRL